MLVNVMSVIFVCILLILCANSDNESVKIQLPINKANEISPNEQSGMEVEAPPVIKSISNITTSTTTQKAFIKQLLPYEPNSQDNPIPNSFLVGFYIFIGLSLITIFLLTYRSYRLRLSRAERRYGVQGDRSTQELTPLPVTIEDDDSENEDQTVFDINRSMRVS